MEVDRNVQKVLVLVVGVGVDLVVEDGMIDPYTQAVDVMVMLMVSVVVDRVVMVYHPSRLILHRFLLVADLLALRYRRRYHPRSLLRLYISSCRTS